MMLAAGSNAPRTPERLKCKLIKPIEPIIGRPQTFSAESKNFARGVSTSRQDVQSALISLHFAFTPFSIGKYENHSHFTSLT
jgi:hypothetical protein